MRLAPQENQFSEGHPSEKLAPIGALEGFGLRSANRKATIGSLPGSFSRKHRVQTPFDGRSDVTMAVCTRVHIIRLPYTIRWVK